MRSSTVSLKNSWMVVLNCCSEELAVSAENWESSLTEVLIPVAHNSNSLDGALTSEASDNSTRTETSGTWGWMVVPNLCTAGAVMIDLEEVVWV